MADPLPRLWYQADAAIRAGSWETWGSGEKLLRAAEDNLSRSRPAHRGWLELLGRPAVAADPEVLALLAQVAATAPCAPEGPATALWASFLVAPGLPGLVTQARLVAASGRALWTFGDRLGLAMVGFAADPTPAVSMLATVNFPEASTEPGRYLQWILRWHEAPHAPRVLAALLAIEKGGWTSRLLDGLEGRLTAAFPMLAAASTVRWGSGLGVEVAASARAKNTFAMPREAAAPLLAWQVAHGHPTHLRAALQALGEVGTRAELGCLDDVKADPELAEEALAVAEKMATRAAPEGGLRGLVAVALADRRCPSGWSFEQRRRLVRLQRGGDAPADLLALKAALEDAAVRLPRIADGGVSGLGVDPQAVVEALDVLDRGQNPTDHRGDDLSDSELVGDLATRAWAGAGLMQARCWKLAGEGRLRLADSRAKLLALAARITDPEAAYRLRVCALPEGRVAWEAALRQRMGPEAEAPVAEQAHLVSLSNEPEVLSAFATLYAVSGVSQIAVLVTRIPPAGVDPFLGRLLDVTSQVDLNKAHVILSKSPMTPAMEDRLLRLGEREDEGSALALRRLAEVGTPSSLPGLYALSTSDAVGGATKVAIAAILSRGVDPSAPAGALDIAGANAGALSLATGVASTPAPQTERSGALPEGIPGPPARRLPLGAVVSTVIIGGGELPLMAVGFCAFLPFGCCGTWIPDQPEAAWRLLRLPGLTFGSCFLIALGVGLLWLHLAHVAQELRLLRDGVCASAIARRGAGSNWTISLRDEAGALQRHGVTGTSARALNRLRPTQGEFTLPVLYLQGLQAYSAEFGSYPRSGRSRWSGGGGCAPRAWPGVPSCT